MPRLLSISTKIYIPLSSDKTDNIATLAERGVDEFISH